MNNDIIKRIEELERELYNTTNKERKNEIIDELNFIEEQYCERY